MTCKCMRQENVIRCYEKCGEDKYYKRLKKGEKGQQQIFCSQKQPGEPEDLPIIGSEGGSISEQKKPADAAKPKKNDPSPNLPVEQSQSSASDDKVAGPKTAGGDHRYQEMTFGGRDKSGSGASVVNAKDMDIDGAAAGFTANNCFVILALTLSVVLYGL
ncbi:hypothetical protein COEREDRAFT_11309 [Coemansia reversa NRRL 1564]|uniref:Uncharacterized protein n=1 Tax=Coemansia reversa (strain ATCC 12441 / NRRL 1564) TaxID=763665 RepID=A0A2G5B3F4_COERN|nr:hypothetical protein COEREDRAFT_11309 [Coemansia reversa NRRL 1564]|eukprot:PIA13549.1 hypothetical protein COEREDRAFT_11309 [Coemansia reversa NRRL 1564]